jgi:hypothetical protein
VNTHAFTVCSILVFKVENVIAVALIGTAGVCFSAFMQYVTITAIKRIELLGQQNNSIVKRTQADVVELKAQTDGLTEALVAVTGAAEHAKGKLEGAAEEKANGH